MSDPDRHLRSKKPQLFAGAWFKGFEHADLVVQRLEEVMCLAAFGICEFAICTRETAEAFGAMPFGCTGDAIDKPIGRSVMKNCLISRRKVTPARDAAAV